PRVQPLGASVLAFHLDPGQRAIGTSLLVHVAPLELAPVTLVRKRRRDPVIGAEVHREPAVPLGPLPVARAPRAIAEPEAVDGDRVAADRQLATCSAVLLQVAARELLPGTLVLDAHPATVLLDPRLATVGRRERGVRELELRGVVGVGREGLARTEPVERPRHHADVAAVRDAMDAHRLDDLEAHAAAVERVVPGDLGATEHEPDAAVGLVETDGHLRVTLVRAIAESHEPSE